MIASLKCQYAELLADIGFIQADLTARKMGRLAPRTGDGVLAATGEMVNHTGRVGNNRSGRRDIRERLFFFFLQNYRKQNDILTRKIGPSSCF